MLANNLSKNYYPVLCNGLAKVVNAFECQIADKLKSDKAAATISEACKYCQYFNDKTIGIEKQTDEKKSKSQAKSWYSSVDDFFFASCPEKKAIYDSKCSFSPIYYEQSGKPQAFKMVQIPMNVSTYFIAKKAPANDEKKKRLFRKKSGASLGLVSHLNLKKDIP